MDGDTGKCQLPCQGNRPCYNRSHLYQIRVLCNLRHLHSFIGRYVTTISSSRKYFSCFLRFLPVFQRFIEVWGVNHCFFPWFSFTESLNFWTKSNSEHTWSITVALVVTLAVYKRLLPPPLTEVTSTDSTINPLPQRGGLNNISGYDNDSFTRSIENTRL